MMNLKIGVFDSGVGGLSVAGAIQEALPDAEILYTEDRDNVPYGTKSPEVIYELVLPILEGLVDQGCDIIVIACNTVSATLSGRLRESIKVPIVALDPMVKPAASTTKSGKIAICATPTTLGSQRYTEIKQKFANNLDVFEPDCSDWSSMIESRQIDHDKIRDRIIEVCERGADVIVLGCTHYHWIEEDIQRIADEYGATVIQPEQAIIKRIKELAKSL